MWLCLASFVTHLSLLSALPSAAVSVLLPLYLFCPPYRFLRIYCCIAFLLLGASPTSLTEIFSECELTFSGSKSPGWKDDVSFHPSKPGGDGGDEAEQPEGPKGPEQGKRAVCRGKFWRNLNRDRGRFALFREERKETESEDGAEEGRVGGASSVTWVLHLQWDRWDAETLLLRPAGRGLRFEGTWGLCAYARVCLVHTLMERVVASFYQENEDLWLLP